MSQNLPQSMPLRNRDAFSSQSHKEEKVFHHRIVFSMLFKQSKWENTDAETLIFESEMVPNGGDAPRGDFSPQSKQKMLKIQQKPLLESRVLQIMA